MPVLIYTIVLVFVFEVILKESFLYHFSGVRSTLEMGEITNQEHLLHSTPTCQAEMFYLTIIAHHSHCFCVRLNTRWREEHFYSCDLSSIQFQNSWTNLKCRK